MKEEKVYFESQGQKIDGILHLPRRRTDSLIILVHGFTGTRNGPGGLFLKLARKLCERNFAVLRFNFRSTTEDFSQLHKMTIKGEVSDLKLIVDRMSERFNKIGLAAESLGGLVSVLAYSEKVKCLVLWYPVIFQGETELGRRFLSKKAEKELRRAGFIKERTSNGKEYKVGKRFVEELRTLNAVPYLKKIRSPTCIIHGEKDNVVSCSHSERLLKILRCPKKLEIFLESSHAFKNEDFVDYNFVAQEKAIKLTASWFTKWLRPAVVSKTLYTGSDK